MILSASKRRILPARNIVNNSKKPLQNLLKITAIFFIQLAQKLHLELDLLDAEIQAVISSLKFVRTQKDRHIICTDSRSVYEAAKNINHCSEPMRHIQYLLMAMNKSVKLMWVPGLDGIVENERHQPIYSFQLAKINLLHY